LRIEEMYGTWREGLPKAYSDAVERLKDADLEGLEGLIVCGMGGSGAAGDYLAALAPGRVVVVKSFRPPRFDGYGVVAVSYSGNTWETLSCLVKAVRDYGLRGVAAVSSGGELASVAASLGIPYVGLPRGMLPRAAFGHMLGALLGVASAAGFIGISGSAVERVAERGASMVEAMSWSDTWAPRIASARALSFIGCESTAPIAVRAKNEFAENAKLPGRLEVYPESAHNDIEAVGAPLDLYIAFKPVSSPCREIVEAVIGVHRDEGVCGAEITVDDSTEESLLEHALKATLAVGLASVRAGRIRGVDPEKTPRIAKYKEKVKGGFGSR